ncbi:hypothetical protein MPSEU_000671900 [Mayamaea pseudoterrestris]|nr:hypothetical protein MPSEU_000671900 [Mayamaea pseudoterrestris]
MRPRRRFGRSVLILHSKRPSRRRHDVFCSLNKEENDIESSTNNSLSFFGASIAPRIMQRRRSRKLHHATMAAASDATTLNHAVMQQEEQEESDTEEPLLKQSHQVASYAGWWSETELQEDNADDDDDGILEHESIETIHKKPQQPVSALKEETRTILKQQQSHENNDDNDENDDEPEEDVMSVLLRFSRWYDETPLQFCGSLQSPHFDASWPSNYYYCQEDNDEQGNDENERSNDGESIKVAAASTNAADQMQQQQVKHSLTSPPTSPTTRRHRRISWADDHEQNLVCVHIVDCSYHNLHDDAILSKYFRRVCILLVAPHVKKFEFISCSYLCHDKLSIKDVLTKLPQLATSPALAQQEYAFLCQWQGSRQTSATTVNDTSGSSSDEPKGDNNNNNNMMELLNASCLQDYSFQWRDVLWATPQGWLPKQLTPAINGLLASRRLQKAVRLCANARHNRRMLPHLLVSDNLPDINVSHDDMVALEEIGASWLQSTEGEQRERLDGAFETANANVALDAANDNINESPAATASCVVGGCNGDDSPRKRLVTLPLEQLAAMFSSAATCHPKALHYRKHRITVPATKPLPMPMIGSKEASLEHKDVATTATALKTRRESRDDDLDGSNSSGSSNSNGANEALIHL